MFRRLLGLILGVIVASTVSVAQDIPVIRPGETLTVTVTEAEEAGVVPVFLVLDSPRVVSISARSQDSTDPAFRLTDQWGRELVIIVDNAGALEAGGPLDAVYEDTLLLAGQYLLDIARIDSDLEGSGEITVSVKEGRLDGFGLGQVNVERGVLEAGTPARLTLPLEAGEIISVGAVAADLNTDLEIAMYDAAGNLVVSNEDNETYDLYFSFTDPRIYQFIVNSSQEYVFEVSGIDEFTAGEFDWVIQRHGFLTGTPTVERLTGSAIYRQRTRQYAEFEAGEVVRITVRKVSGNLDPEVQVLDPDSVILAINDDHSTEAADLDGLDARISQLIIAKSGSHEINVVSVDGSGDYEIEIQRLGKFVSR
jgi:predicted  nucleic acid-binding Zn-ribbon protein